MANALTLLSAVVCVGSLMLVGRSFVRTDAVLISTVKEHVSSAATIDGQLWLVHATGSDSFFYSYFSRSSAAARPDASTMRTSLRGVPRSASAGAV